MATEEVAVREPLQRTTSGLTAIRKFETIATSQAEAFNTFSNDTGIVIGTPYQDTSGVSVSGPIATVREISVASSAREISGEETPWLITVRYSSPSGNTARGLELVPGGDAVWYIEQGLSSTPIDVDVNGDIIANGANVPYESITALRPKEALIAEWVETSISFVSAVNRSRSYLGKINSATFVGADAGELLCYGLNPEPLDNDSFTGTGDIKFRARFEYRKNRDSNIQGWDLAFQNIGRFEKNPDYDDTVDPPSAFLRPIMVGAPDTDVRRQVISPVPLDANGAADLEKDKPEILGFVIYESANFGNIGIPGVPV